MKSPYEIYLSELGKTRVATQSAGTRDLEHQHRPALKTLLEAMLPDVNAVNEPGKIEFGAPDYALMKGGYPIGYVETKRIGENLDDIAKGEQLKRYFGYANLVLSNYLEFRFYKHGEQYGDSIIISDAQTFTPNANASVLLETTIRAFLKDAAEPVLQAGTLAKIMGENGKRLRANLLRFLKAESEKNRPILEIYGAFKTQLIRDLSLEDFTDMYAQTLVYGLFVARYHDETTKDFSRQEARDLIPNTNPLLRRFFDHIAGGDFDTRLAPIVDELCKVFGNTDVRSLMQQLYKQDLWGVEHVAPDPVIHFYEDFLKNYDPEQRKKLGAYYTPPAVVNFIVRSIDSILKRNFNLPDGLADKKKITITRESQGKKIKDDIHQVQVLDPAVGTGTFLNEVIRLIRRSFTGQEGRFSGYVSEDLLPRLHGFELMMAPYTIAHLKLAATLRESGAKDFKNRIGVYLTNSLEKGQTIDGTLFSLGLAQSISEESHAASRIKNDMPIMVVLGNPPYAGESSNKNYTDHDVYKVEPGTTEKLREQNSKWINDDYVKFIRLAESLIEKTGEGIVAMITAHGYLDNPTFRGMRYHLMQTLNELYVLDLHGNANKKEISPDGSKDENIFAIKQGVAILIGVKHKGKRSGKLAKIFRADCFGMRREKLFCINEMNFETAQWQEMVPQAPSYEWVARDEKTRKEYQEGFSVAELFSISGVGIVTARDNFVIGEDEKILIRNAEHFRDSSASTQASLCAEVGISNKKGWDALKARAVLQKDTELEKFLKPILYRPFDTRIIFYHPSLVWRTVDKVMRHMIKGENIGLEVCRQTIGDSWEHVFITNRIVDDSYVSNRTRERGYVLPLYVYAEDGDRVPNLDREIVKKIAEFLDASPTPENIFDYIYAVLHSPDYREKYKEFLKIDFPRVPYPKDKAQFDVLVALGKELRELHLLESPKIRQFITSYTEGGTNKVEKVKYRDGKVFINETQYFGNVPKEAWMFHVGGYQPAQKWLKDRIGRILSDAEIEHYQKIIVVLSETMRIMGEISKIV